MFILLFVIAIIVCVLLGIIVLIQNPKGGGLSSNFSSSSQLMGVQRTGDFLEKGTWILAIALMVISLAMNIASKSGSQADTQSQQLNNTREASKPSGSGAATPVPQMNLSTKPAGTAPATTPAPQQAAPKK